MGTESLLEDCQALITKGHESWKSYFSKWEQFAKYEEDVPESELCDVSRENHKSKKQSTSNTGKKRQPLQTKSSISNKKSKKIKRKLNKKKKISSGNKQQVVKYSNNENSDEKKEEDVQLETILKTVLSEFLKSNKNEFKMLTVLSQTFSGSHYPQFLHPWEDSRNPLQLTPTRNLNRSICPNRGSYIEHLQNQSIFLGINQPMEGLRNQILNNSFPNCRSNVCEQRLLPVGGSPVLKPTQPTPQINLEIRNCNSTFLPSFCNKDTKLKSLKWDLSLKSPSSVCRKINKEYFIKRNLLKMNITHDGKRFRNLCLRKRTNSVTLSMENSNFTTPERKPPERKCFSENVLRGKGRRPSKLFFGNEDEDSESDDQTVTHAPIIRSKNGKSKSEIIHEAPESDSDDCESIFDRVKI